MYRSKKCLFRIAFLGKKRASKIVVQLCPKKWCAKRAGHLACFIFSTSLLSESLAQARKTANGEWNGACAEREETALDSQGAMGRYPMGHVHTAGILSRETAKALSYHRRPRSENLGSEARQVKQGYFSLSGQNGRRVTKAHKLQKLIHRSPGLEAKLSWIQERANKQGRI